MAASKQQIFLTVLEARKYKIKEQADLVSGEDLFPRELSLAAASHGGRAREFSWASFIRALVPFVRIPHTTFLGVKFQNKNLTDISIQNITFSP